MRAETAEDLHTALSLINYSRNRFTINLIPLLEQATGLRRVVSVFAAACEGPVALDDLQGWKVPIMKGRGHASSLVTLSLEALARKAPSVTFIHNFPGAIKTNIIRGGEGFIIGALGVLFKILAPLFFMPLEECGERHLFLATSAKYPARSGGQETVGVPLPGAVSIARSTDGQDGGGIYSIDASGESAGPKIEKMLATLRKEGAGDKVWDDNLAQFKRITGSETI